MNVADKLHKYPVNVKWAIILFFVMGTVPAYSDDFDKAIASISNRIEERGDLSFLGLRDSLFYAARCVHNDSARLDRFQKLLVNLAANRNRMSVQANWLLSAFEIEFGSPTRESLLFAIDALSKTVVTYSWSYGIENFLRYEESDEALRFVSREDVFWIRSSWMKGVALVKQLPHGAELISSALEVKIVDYLTDIERSLKTQTFEAFQNLLKIFASPEMRTFRNLELQESFYKRLIEIANRYLDRNSQAIWYAMFRRVRFIEDEKLKNSDSLRKTFVGWFAEKPIFLLTSDLKKMLSNGWISLEEILEILTANPTPSYFKSIETLINNRELDAFSHLIASLCLLKMNRWAVENRFESPGLALNAIQEILAALENTVGHWSGGLVTAGDLEAVWIDSSVWINLRREFFLTLQSVRGVPSGVAMRVFRFDDNWFGTQRRYPNIEIEKLNTVELLMGSEEFVKLVEKNFLSNQRLLSAESLSLARYLRLRASSLPPHGDLSSSGALAKRGYINQKILDRVSKSVMENVKERKRRFYERKKPLLDPKYWTENSRELITFMSELNPFDNEFREFVSRAFLEDNIPGFRSREALYILEKTGAASEEIRDKLERQLAFVGVGDTAANFRTYLRLFPSRSKEIAKIVYVHRLSAEKLEAIKSVLFQEATVNPAIAVELKQTQSTSNSKEWGPHYEGLSLSNWLEESLRIARTYNIRIPPKDCRALGFN